MDRATGQDGRAQGLRTGVLVCGGVLLLVLAVGVAVALLGLASVRADLAALRTALGSEETGGRPTAPPPPALPAEPVSLAGAQLKGSEHAKVAILTFSDFQCPYCTRFTATTYPELVTDYLDTGRVLLAFRHFPIDQIHPNARKAAEAADCAGRQGKFWAMHDRLFLDPTRLSVVDLQRHAAAMALRQPEFTRCLGGEVAEKVQQDVAEAARLQVYGTPSFLVGTIEPGGRLKVTNRFSGAHQIGTFRAVLDRLLIAAGVE